MVKHMIIWKMKEDIADKAAKKAENPEDLDGSVETGAEDRSDT